MNKLTKSLIATPLSLTTTMAIKKNKTLSIILSFSIIFSCFCFNKNKVECDSITMCQSKMMAIAGQTSWPNFAVNTLLTIVPILLPAAKGAEVIKDINEESSIVQKIVGLITDKIHEAATGDIVGLCWTVIDIVVTFLPGGNTFKVAKLALVIPKLVADL